MQIVNAFAERFSELAPEPQHFPEWCTASAEPYGRHLLYQCAATGVAAHLIVWEPGLRTPIHDHGDVEWGFLYCMAGELTVTNYEVGDFEAATSRAELQAASRMKLQAGCYDALVSTRPTVHSLQNKGKTTAYCINIYAEKIESYRVFRSGSSGCTGARERRTARATRRRHERAALPEPDARRAGARRRRSGHQRGDPLVQPSTTFHRTPGGPVAPYSRFESPTGQLPEAVLTQLEGRRRRALQLRCLGCDVRVPRA